jgi:hypothetical protein
MRRYFFLFPLVLHPITLPMHQHQQELDLRLAHAVRINAPTRSVVHIINQGARPHNGIIPAITNGNIPLLRLLLTYGARLRIYNDTLIHTQQPSLFTHAVISPKALKIIKMLSANGLKPTRDDYITACLHKIYVIDKLIKYGVDPDTPIDTYNHTVLMGLVTSYSSYPISFIKKYIHKLIALDADIDHRNTDGKTALILCIQRSYSSNQYAIAQTLLQLGANPLIQDNDGNTALDYTNDAPIIQLLSDHIYAQINTLQQTS